MQSELNLKHSRYDCVKDGLLAAQVALRTITDHYTAVTKVIAAGPAQN